MASVLFNQEEETTWEKADSMQTLPDGIYDAELIDATITMVGQERRKKLLMIYRIKSPLDFQNMAYKHFLPLDNPKIMWITKNAVKLFGITCKLAELENKMEAHVGAQVQFELVTDGKYQNAKILNVATQAKATSDNSDLPF